MAVTEYSFLEIDANEANDIPLRGHHLCSFTAEPVTVPAPEAPDAVIGLAKYTEQWTFPEPAGEPVELTQAEYVSLKTTARTPVTKAATYPRLNVMTAAAPTWTLYPVEITSVVDAANKGDGFKRYITVTFKRRSVSGSLTFVVDSGGGNAVTLDMPGLEQVRQLLNGFAPPQTTTGDGESTIAGPLAVSATVVGYAATGDLDKLQKVLDAKTAVEMVGACFDTSGGGYLPTELPAAAKAYLVDLQVMGRAGATALVQLVISHDRA